MTTTSTPTTPAPSSLGHIPAGPWAFDESVTTVFDDMLRRSIPDYDMMRHLVQTLGGAFVQPDTDVLDLGCSRGEALAPFVHKFGPANRYTGVEVSQPMLAAARERLAAEIAAGYVDIQELDLRLNYPTVRASLTLAVLTIQFIPINYRRAILDKIYRSTVPGGAFIMVEKVLGDTSVTDWMLVDHYHAMKQAHGYSREEVERKALALEGVLVPCSAKWNEELLRGAGFRHIECFWRCLSFAGWIAVRDY